MTKSEIAKYIDHTNLNACATKKDIIKLCGEARKYAFASVCVNPYFVPLADSLLKGSGVKVCSVVGFPLGAVSKDEIAFEAAQVVRGGAREVDMVVNLSMVKDSLWDDVYKEIAAVRKSVDEEALKNGIEEKIILKVILETCFLSDEEIVEACGCAKKAAADFVKTSTGFAILKDKDEKLLPNGATARAVSLMRKTVGSGMGVKASGGIHSFEEACAMIEAGATRIGASAGVQIVS